jgi:hypothetical protein
LIRNRLQDSTLKAISDDAYFYPDDGSQVFIGFVGGSASLSQQLPYPSGSNNYSRWVDRFYYYALYYNDMSINDALDHASFELYGMWFANPYVPLRSFTAYWWNPSHQGETGQGSMAVYGNGRLRLKSFGDDFNDGNYNGWTPTLGSWSAITTTLRSQGQSLIRTNQQFTSDRYVRVQAKTLVAGSGNGDVAWVMPKYVDFNNMVSASLRKDGTVQLAIVKNGQSLTWSGSTPFNPLNTNTLEVNIVGTKAWVWLNGNLKLTVTHDWLDDFGGYAALYSHSGSNAEFDDITVLDQTYQTTYHKLIISSGTGGSTSPSTGTYRYSEGTPVTVTAYPQSGYVFDQWLLDGQPAGTNPTKIVTMNQFHTLQATFLYQPGVQVSTSATADVAITPSASYDVGTSPTISWVAADDYGAYYCYLTEVIVDGVPYSPNEYGDVHSGSITFNNIQSSHSVVVHSAPYYYPVTFNVYAHNDNFGDMLVNSWTEYRVAWEERDGPVYSHGSDLHGGGPVTQYVDYSIDDPWGWGTDYFNYAYIPNWGGGSEQWCYSIPFDVWTFTWGNTVDIWYYYGYYRGDMPSNTTTPDTGTQIPIPPFPEGFTPPASTPYIYDSKTNTYVPVR